MRKPLRFPIISRFVLIIAVMLCCLTIPFAAVKFASAAGTGTSHAIKLSVVVGPPTSFTKVTGANFGASETVKLYFDTKVDGSTTTTSTGTFSFTIKIPRMATPGSHTIKATGQTSQLSATAPFLVRTDWSQAGFDAAQTRYNPYENVISASNAAQLTNAWTNNYTAPIYSTPIVAGGRVFIISNKLYAMDATTGASLWSSSFTGYLVVDGGIVYVASTQLYALKASTGALLWSTPLNGNGALFDPVIAHGVIYLYSFNGSFYAFNAQNGKQIWSNNTCSSYVATPAVASGLLYVGCSNNTLYAFNSKTGATQWTYTTASSINTTVAVANNLVYVSDGSGVLYALNALTGILVWSDTNASYKYGTPIVAGNTLFIQADGVFAFNAQTGTPLWSAETNQGLRFPASAANDVVYLVIPVPGIIVAIDANTGKPLWNSYLDTDNFNGAPVIANGMVYIGIGNTGLVNQGTLYAYHLKTH